MKRPLFTGAVFAALASLSPAQWTTETYRLLPGWNGIYTLNDASHVPLNTLFADVPEITQVWRWEPTALASQFIGDPAQAVPGEEWKTWRRNDPENSTMSRLLPNFGHLVVFNGGVPRDLPVLGKAVLPRIDWRSTGANLVGFPADASAPPRFGSTTSGYFAPLGGVGYSPLSTNIYRYLGGDLGPSNPGAIPNLAQERVQRGRAYWVELPAYSDFVSPVGVELSSGASLDFGTRGGPQKILVTNRSAAALDVQLTPSASQTPPPGQPAIAGVVPLLQRVFSETLQDFEFVPLPGQLTATLGPGASQSWTLVADRSAMGAAPGSSYASLIQITDSGNHGAYSEIVVPVTAEQGDLGGLWVGDAVVSGVQNQLQRFARNPDGSNVIDSDGNYVLIDSTDAIAGTPRGFPLRIVVHVDGGGTARLLSNVYFGLLDTDPPVPGFATAQRFIRPDALAEAARVSANHLPLDVAAELAGGFDIGASGSTTVTLAHDAPTNPFVHTYHPDHDNLDGRFENPLPPGDESHTVTRAITLTVDSSSPDNDPSWGTTILTGTYAETLTGLHKNSIATQGRFALRRVSEETILAQ